MSSINWSMNTHGKWIIFITIVILISCDTSSLSGQELRYANNWLIGYDGNDGHTQFNFNQDTLNLSVFKSKLEIDENIAFSDKDGKLLFYTNGCQIYNYNHTLMKNGDSLITRDFGHYCERNLSLPFYQGMLVIPSSLQKDKYFLIHPNNERITLNGELAFGVSEYYISQINFNQENLDGIVSKKGSNLIKGNFEGYGIDVCKHANGIDWWIVIPDYGMNCFNLFLFKNDSFYSYPHQCISSDKIWGLGSGSTKFSPDGKYLVISDNEAGTTILNFDRCTGNLSFRENITFDEINTFGSYSEFSRNSRFLYVSNIDSLWQLDLNSSSISNSKLLIDTWDQAVPRSRFGSMQLAPDGKIYLASRGTSVYYHLINSPDKQGKACDFVQRAITLPTYYYYYIPSYPNYNLGADSSICNTSSIHNWTKKDCDITLRQTGRNIIITTDENYNRKDFTISILNPIGQNIPFCLNRNSNTEYEINIDGDRRGIYFITFYSKLCGFQLRKIFID